MKETMRLKADIRPSYANRHAAGLDIRANNDKPIEIDVGEVRQIPTGLSLQIPENHFGMVVPRPGPGFKHRITLINDVGIIDEDYRGEKGVKLVNDGDTPYTVNKGERICQMIVIPYIQPTLIYTDDLEETDRGTSGFGSTGK